MKKPSPMKNLSPSEFDHLMSRIGYQSAFLGYVWAATLEAKPTTADELEKALRDVAQRIQDGTLEAGILGLDGHGLVETALDMAWGVSMYDKKVV